MGTKDAERIHPVDAWPRGGLGTLALNSNHEMYDGGFGLFEVAYEAYDQNGTSYFALMNRYWIIVGLDSAYYANQAEMFMTGRLNPGQVEWLGQIAEAAGRRKVIVLSHHPGLNEAGQPPKRDDGSTGQSLWSQVCGALEPVGPFYWYWGHIHEAIVYPVQGVVFCRCAGHGCIPYGPASELAGPHKQGAITWYETQSAQDANDPLRVLNGFVTLELNGPNLVETFIGENNAVRWSSRSL